MPHRARPAPLPTDITAVIARLLVDAFLDDTADERLPDSHVNGTHPVACPAGATDASPGSTRKLEVLAERVRLRLSLHHPADNPFMSECMTLVPNPANGAPQLIELGRPVVPGEAKVMRPSSKAPATVHIALQE